MSLFVALAWLLPLFGVGGMGAPADAGYALNAMHWMLALPVGGTFIVNGFMHTFLAKKTAAMIGWQTNGFQYEIGFVSYGIGIAGIVASATSETMAWLVVSIIVSVFLLGAAANHIVEMFRDKNFKPGNSVILIYDIGLPASLIILLIANGVIF